MPRLRLLSILMITFSILSSPLAAEESSPIEGTLKIDEFLQQKQANNSVPAAPVSDDATFVRRAYLDLVGRIPTIEERQNFLTDGRADKREALIDLLIESEDHVQHLADMFDTLLMGRGSNRAYEERKKHQWRAWLERGFRENRPWNEMVEQMLLARPATNDERGAIWFLYEA